MSALLHLPPKDELTLTPKEIREITGCAGRAMQIAWFKLNAWQFSLNRADEPVVGRLYANLKLAGLEVSTIIKPAQWEVDMSVLQ